METTVYCHSKKSKMKKFVFGIMVILTGVAFLGFNAGFFDVAYRHIVISWPMLLVAIGVINLFDRNSFISGTIILAIGAFFLIPKFSVFPDNFVHVFWPVLLIFAGVMIIFKHLFFKKCADSFHKHRVSEFKNDSGYIEETNIFGGSKQVITSPVFKGGKVTNIFGGTNLDLSQTNLEGTNNVLEISCVFGGIEIKAPQDWNIKIEVTSVMGGFTDKHSYAPKTNDSNKSLTIRGSVVFGGGEIKRV
jgi:predicted membrane protein